MTHNTIARRAVVVGSGVAGLFAARVLSDYFDEVILIAPSKGQCRNGGWRNYTDATGQPFRNQGECIAFALGAA